MAANKKFEKLGVNPNYVDYDNEETETQKKKKVNKYSFRKAVPEKFKEKVYEVGFIKVYIAFIACFILSVFNGLITGEGFYDGFSVPYSFVAKSVAYLIIFVVPALIYCKVYGKGGFSLLGIRRFSLSYSTFIILGLVLMTLVIAAEKFALAYYFYAGLSETQVSLVGSNNVIGIIITHALVPAICEELLLRGVLQNEISAKAGGFTGILVSALAFSLIHLNAEYFIIYFSSGLILAITMHVCGSVIPCIVIHALNNLFSLCFSKQLTFVASERAGNVLVLIMLTICIFITGLFWLKSLELICIKKSATIEISNKDKGENTQINFYTTPYKIPSDTGYSFHKFLRVLFSPAIIISVIIFLFVTLM